MTAGEKRPALDADQTKALGALLGMQRQSWEQGVATHALLNLGQYELFGVMARPSAVIRAASALVECWPKAAARPTLPDGSFFPPRPSAIGARSYADPRLGVDAPDRGGVSTHSRWIVSEVYACVRSISLGMVTVPP